MSTDIYYFVIWEMRLKAHSQFGESTIRNTIVRNRHPVVWAARPQSGYDDHFITVIRSWQEIPAEVALNPDVRRWVGMED